MAKIMLGSVYDAFKSANVPDDKARAAAEDVAEYENSIAEIKSDIKLLKWMVTAVIGGIVALLVKVYFP